LKDTFRTLKISGSDALGDCSMSEVKYRINTPTIALFIEEGRQVARTIPGGTEVTVDESAITVDRLIEVRWRETTVMMFAQDIKSRGTKINETSR